MTVNSHVFHLGLALVVFSWRRTSCSSASSPAASGRLPSNLVHAGGSPSPRCWRCWRRLTHLVMRLLSHAGDYVSWLETTLPVYTGLLATAHPRATRRCQRCKLLRRGLPRSGEPFGVDGLPVHAATGMRFSHRGEVA